MLSTFLKNISLVLECLIQLKSPIVSTWPLIIIKLQIKCDFIHTYYSLSFMPMVYMYVETCKVGWKSSCANVFNMTHVAKTNIETILRGIPPPAH